MGWLKKYQNGEDERYEAVKKQDNTYQRVPMAYTNIEQGAEIHRAQNPTAMLSQDNRTNEEREAERVVRDKEFFSDTGTIMLKAVETFGTSVIGDAVQSVSPDAADWLEKYSSGFIPHTSEQELMANRTTNPNKWSNRMGSTAGALNSTAVNALAMGALASLPGGALTKGIKSDPTIKGRLTPHSVLEDEPIRNSFLQPTQTRTQSPLPKNMEPYLSQRMQPLSKEESLFQKTMDPNNPQHMKRYDTNLQSRTEVLNPQGEVIEPIYRGVYLNNEIRNSAKFKGKTDDEILEIMGTTIPGSTNTRRKGQFTQTLNFGRNYDSALEHIGKHTDPKSIQTLGNTADFVSGDMYVLKVQPQHTPFISSDIQKNTYKVLESGKKKIISLF